METPTLFEQHRMLLENATNVIKDYIASNKDNFVEIECPKFDENDEGILLPNEERFIHIEGMIVAINDNSEFVDHEGYTANINEVNPTNVFEIADWILKNSNSECKIKMETYYRVRPRHFGFAPQDYKTLEEAIERSNDRNRVRPDTNQVTDKDNYTSIWYGDFCTLQKLTVITEQL